MEAVWTGENLPDKLEDLLSRCRFCLKQHAAVLTISPYSDILKMFAILTGIELNIPPKYSILVCESCKTQLNHVWQIRDDFLRIANHWRKLLLDQASDFDRKLIIKNTEHTLDKATEDKALIMNLEMVETEYAFHKCEHDSDSEDNILLGQLRQKQTIERPKHHHPTSTLICDICGDQLTNRQLLVRHMSAKHSRKSTNRTNTPTTCYICGKTNLKRMSQHMRDHRKEDKFKCRHCPKSFNRHGMMVQHERHHTGERPFICEMCAFSFTSAAALKRHCKMHTLPDDGISKTFQKVQQINRLRPVQTQPIPKLPPHQGIRPECPICRNTYVNRVSIQRHMKLQHGTEGMVAWKKMLDTTCMVCNEKFTSNVELANHKSIHIGHQCPICRRRFHSKITLDLHIENHSKKARPFKCDQCEACYPCAFTLKIHVRRAHSDERPFKCAQCGHGFVERSVLNAHLRKVHSIHGQLKSHSCPLCPESFKSKDALRSHTEKHTGQYRYMCGLCQRNMYSGPQLAEHERIYHPEKMSSTTGD